MSSLRSSFSVVAILLAATLSFPAQQASDKKPAVDEGISYGIVVDNSGSYRKMLENLIQFIGKFWTSRNRPTRRFLSDS